MSACYNLKMKGTVFHQNDDLTFKYTFFKIISIMRCSTQTLCFTLLLIYFLFACVCLYVCACSFLQHYVDFCSASLLSQFPYLSM